MAVMIYRYICIKCFSFEHVLMRLELSKYRDNIILKGGVLLSSIIGNDMRTTKDIDATLKSIPLNIISIRNIFDEILSIKIDDGVSFRIESIKDIRLEDEYSGFRLNIFATFDKLKTNFFLEVTTGDVITPREIKYKYKSIFTDKEIDIMAYTIETIISEKFHSIITKNVTTTRSKDFYDLYMLMIKNNYEINNFNLVKAIKNTFARRDTKFDIVYFNEVVKVIENSQILESNFNQYRKKLQYAKVVNYQDTMEAIKKIIYILEKEMMVV